MLVCVSSFVMKYSAVCHKKAGDAFTRTRLMPTCGVSAALSVARPQAGNVQRKAGWRSKGGVLGVWVF